MQEWATNLSCECHRKVVLLENGARSEFEGETLTVSEFFNVVDDVGNKVSGFHSGVPFFCFYW